MDKAEVSSKGGRVDLHSEAQVSKLKRSRLPQPWIILAPGRGIVMRAELEILKS